MKIFREALAETLESSDLMVRIAPRPTAERELVLQSEVMQQFGAQIEAVARDTQDKLEVEDALVVMRTRARSTA